MSAIYKRIKKQNGERFAQTLRDHHNGLLEVKDIDLIVKHAGKGKDKAVALLPYLMTLLAANDDIQQDAPGNPFDLLDQAGYDAFHADTLEKQNSIQHHFQRGELLFNEKILTEEKKDKMSMVPPSSRYKFIKTETLSALKTDIIILFLGVITPLIVIPIIL